MIRLTRLSGEPFVLNAELIRYVEERPDTFITLTVGERIVVQESMDTVLLRAIDYQRQKHWMPPLPPLTDGGEERRANQPPDMPPGTS